MSQQQPLLIKVIDEKDYEIATDKVSKDQACDEMQEYSIDSVVDCVYGLATNVASIIVTLWTIPNLTISYHVHYQYCP